MIDTSSKPFKFKYYDGGSVQEMDSKTIQDLLSEQRYSIISGPSNKNELFIDAINKKYTDMITARQRFVFNEKNEKELKNVIKDYLTALLHKNKQKIKYYIPNNRNTRIVIEQVESKKAELNLSNISSVEINQIISNLSEQIRTCLNTSLEIYENAFITIKANETLEYKGELTLIEFRKFNEQQHITFLLAKENGIYKVCYIKWFLDPGI